jgi:hypothetical protein
MKDKIEALQKRIKKIEKEGLLEIQKKQKEFFYEIRKKKVYFKEEIKRKHKRQSKKIGRYLYDAPFLHKLTAPVIWFAIVPALFMDLFATIYQAICFPVYGIPKVKRSDYIVIDRNYLEYLNIIEKINCVYCGYFTGLIGFVQEIAARTEQYWCPIKHARKTKAIHSRYNNFFMDYGDGDRYQEKLKKIRKSFDDIE